MKALTIKNPWSYLIASGIKDVENRTWKTNFRGRIYIHSSKKFPFMILEQVLTEAQWKSINLSVKEPLLSGEAIPTGAIIGEVDIVDCVVDSKSVWAEPEGFHWVLENPVLYKKPILNVKGKLSFWQYAPDQRKP